MHRHWIYLRTLIGTSFKASAALRGAFLLNCAFMALNNLVMFANWWIIFQKIESIGGWRIQECALLWSISAASYGFSVVLFNGSRRLGRYIVLGELDTFLTQPRNPLLQVMTSNSSASGWGDVLSSVILLWLSGYLRPAALPALLLALLCSIAVITACAVTFQCLAFWAGDVREFSTTLWEFLVAFSTYPDPIYQGLLRLALFSILPVGFIAFLPVSAVRSPDFAVLALLCGGAGFYLWLMVQVFGRGLRRYASGSGMQIRG